MAGRSRWTDWLAATAIAAGGVALLVLAGWLWRQDRELQSRGIGVAAELVSLQEQAEGRAIAELRFDTPRGPVTVRRLVGKEARAGWRVGGRVPMIYLADAAYDAQPASDRSEPVLVWIGLGLAVLAVAGFWMRRLWRARAAAREEDASVTPAAPRQRAPVPRTPVTPAADADMLGVARHLVAMESGAHANAYLARGEFALGVDVGDAAADIADSWNRMLGNGAPLRHEAVSWEAREADTHEDPVWGRFEFRGRRAEYRLQEERVTDALLAVHALAQVVRPDLELRFCRDSWGGTVLEFLPLPPAAWAAVAAEFGAQAVGRRFAPIPGDFDAFERLVMEDPPDWAR